MVQHTAEIRFVVGSGSGLGARMADTNAKMQKMSSEPEGTAAGSLTHASYPIHLLSLSRPRSNETKIALFFVDGGSINQTRLSMSTHDIKFDPNTSRAARMGL